MFFNDTGDILNLVPSDYVRDGQIDVITDVTYVQSEVERDRGVLHFIAGDIDDETGAITWDIFTLPIDSKSL